MRSATAATGLVGVLALLSVLVSPAVSAHADYLSSNPDAGGEFLVAPTSVTITFTERVTPGSAVIRVANATQRFDLGTAVLSDDGRTATIQLVPIGPGVYVVTWVTQSAVDGHSTSGSFGFVVLNPDGTRPGDAPERSTAAPVSPTEIGFRFVGFVGLALALGAAALGVLIWLPAGRDPDALASSAYAPSLRTILHWGRVGAFAYGIGTFGLWIQVVGFDGEVSAEALLGSPFLLSVLGRGAIAIALLVVLSTAFTRSAREGLEATGPRLRLGLSLALVAIAVGSAGTHAAASPSFGLLGIVANAAHLAGAALWVGGLTGIFLVRRFLRDSTATALARHVYARFSHLAGYSVALILGGGTILALLLVESVEGLASTPYGWVILAKLSLFAPMVALGAFNRYRLVPGLADVDAPAAVRTLTRNVRVESSMGATVLALAALLTALVPAATIVGPLGPSGPLELQTTSDGVRWDLTVSPYPRAPGTFILSLLLWNATTGDPFRDVVFGSGNLTMTLVGGTVNRTEPLEGPHSNHLFLQDAALDQAGTWRLLARMVRYGGGEIGAMFNVMVGEG